ncbi:MAG: ATP-dependent helicase [Anaerolineales bacterium]|nr:ATP-dependent helicase [Anaerolineales bacterium]
MSKLPLTEEQEKILEEQENCVVVASPGSGKTFIISRKIQQILTDLPGYKGVIAISFTNKASNELERRCLSSGANRKGSYFGTIDSFFITEIIIPFGTHVFGIPQNEIQVIKLDDFEDPEEYDHLRDLRPLQTVRGDVVDDITALFVNGVIVLETVGFLALYIFDISRSCRRYLKARYSYIFIDEYQDCDRWQHQLFIKLARLGLISWAVGDVNQSIFAFANKDSRYLMSMTQDGRFTTYPLTVNHRCHTSIANYSARLLTKDFIPNQTDDIRVLHKHIDGCEIDIAEWLSEAIPRMADHYQVEHPNKIAILVKNWRTNDLIHQNLSIPHKPVIPTPLDEDSSLWGSVLRKILYVIFSPELTKHELVEKYLHTAYQQRAARSVLKTLSEIEAVANQGPYLLQAHLPLFVDVATKIFPQAQNQLAINNLRQVLENNDLLNSFIPAQEEEVQLMTLHKAKGLEFEIVYHLNLYRWIFPQYRGDRIQKLQDLNLHYVGVTRAKSCCVLCTSSERHNWHEEIIQAEPSEFLARNGVEELRINCEF